MRLDFSTDRVLAVVAHPDDAEICCAGTLARAKRDGAAIGVCVLCKGDKGQPDPPLADLAEVRAEEMRAAAELLGAELFRGDQPDGELACDAPTRALLVEIFRKFRPTLVFAHSLSDYHPDHRAAGELAEAASWYCASRGHESESPPLEAPPELWWMDTINAADFEPGFYVDVSAFVDLKEQLIACHASQLSRSKDADFGPLVAILRNRQTTRGAQSGVAAAEAYRLHQAFHRVRAW